VIRTLVFFSFFRMDERISCYVRNGSLMPRSEASIFPPLDTIIVSLFFAYLDHLCGAPFPTLGNFIFVFFFYIIYLPYFFPCFLYGWFLVSTAERKYTSYELLKRLRHVPNTSSKPIKLTPYRYSRYISACASR